MLRRAVPASRRDVLDLITDLGPYACAERARTPEEIVADLERVMAVLTLDLPAVRTLATAVLLDAPRDAAFRAVREEVLAAGRPPESPADSGGKRRRVVSVKTLLQRSDAEEVRPWRPGDGRRPAVRVFPYGRQPLMRVRAQGRWHTAPVLARHDHHSGRVAYQVDIELTIDGQHHVGTTRMYWWDPQTMQPLRPGTR